MYGSRGRSREGVEAGVLPARGERGWLEGKAEGKGVGCGRMEIWVSRSATGVCGGGETPPRGGVREAGRRGSRRGESFPAPHPPTTSSKLSSRPDTTRIYE